MNDRRQDIPIGCAVNVAIINELSRTDVFNEACINVPLKFNIKPPNKGAPWPFFNISWGSYMMYCLLVVSKEIYKLLTNNPIYWNAFKNFHRLDDFNSYVKTVEELNELLNDMYDYCDENLIWRDFD